MAQELFVRSTDDISGGLATQTVSFGLDEHVYVIDLNNKHAAELDEFLSRFIEAASPADELKKRVFHGGEQPVRPRTRGESIAYNKRVRRWAIEQGRQAEIQDEGGKERYYIPAAVFQDYEEYLRQQAR